MESQLPLKDWVKRVLYIIAIAKKDKDVIYSPEKITPDFGYLVRKFHGDGVSPGKAAKKIMSLAEKWAPKTEKEIGPLAESICDMIDEEMDVVVNEEDSELTGDDFFNNSSAADELLIYIENDGDLHRQRFLPIVKNLVRKQKADIYDHFLAIKLFLYLVDAGAKKFVQEFDYGQIWNKVFPKNIRIEVAKELTKVFESDYELGEYDYLIPKKYLSKEQEGVSLEEEKDVMRITKESLLKLIREEINKVLKEEPLVSNPANGKEEDFSETLEEVEVPRVGEEDFSETDRTVTEVEVPRVGEEDFSETDRLVTEETPPGREKQVKALKKELPKTYVDKKTGERKESSPWAVAWKSYQDKEKD